MHLSCTHKLLIPLLLLFFFDSTNASYGERSETFNQCMPQCYRQKCTDETLFVKKQPWILWLTRWSCHDECSYECMWTTEKEFKRMGYNIKFFGKWPFRRVLGMQEVASVVASLLNLASHLYTLKAMKKNIPQSSPMLTLWKGLTLCAINAWTWSAVFHARDTPLTEKLDYFSSISMVMFTFFVFLVRISLKRKLLHLCLALLGVCYYVCHCSYMLFVKFDYGLNMKVNVTIGITNSVGWLVWWFKDRKRLPHLYKAVICVVLAMSLMSLEVWDFPPYHYLFDAHSLWHLGTCPLALIMYRFIADDCKHLYKRQLDEPKMS